MLQKALLFAAAVSFGVFTLDAFGEATLAHQDGYLGLGLFLLVAAWLTP